jgi:hypothetical protein
MLGPTIAPSEVKSGCKYWLRADGAAFEVKEHLAFAREIQDASDEYDSRRRWGYDDMFRHGWVRIGEDISAGNGEGMMTPAQERWIEKAKIVIR